MINRITTKMLTHAISPAPVDDSDWSNVFEKNITKRNPDGTPSEGSIVIHFGITQDMRTLAEGNFHTNIFNACNKPNKSMRMVKQPMEIYELLQPGMIIALKKGKSLYAWAEITQGYYYRSDNSHMTPHYYDWYHYWDYKILRMAKEEEAGVHGGWIATFHKNTIQIPADVLKIHALNKLRQSIMDHREKKTLLYNKMQEATASFQAAEEELNSLERTLELSEVM